MALCDRLEAAQTERKNRRHELTTTSLHYLSNGGSDGHFDGHGRFCLSHFQHLTTGSDQIPTLRQTILKLAVRGRLISQDCNDEPAARFLGDRELVRDSAADPLELPSGWAWSSLGLIGESLGGGTPSKANPEYWTGSIPWVSPKDMKVDEINDAQDHISSLAVEQSAARLIPVGSLFMVVRGMILAHSFPTAITTIPVTINQDMKAIVPFRADLIRFLLLLTKGLKPEVLRLVLRSTHGQQHCPYESLNRTEMKERFEKDGRPQLVDALKRQEFVGGNLKLAEALIKHGELVEYQKGDKLITEGGEDNDIYLLLTGSVAVVIKGNDINTRKAGQHVGEMAAIEPSLKRSATIVAHDTVVALKLKSADFSSIGEDFPQVWLPIARELSRRLLQRNDLIPPPNEYPKLFIISSAEALEVAHEIQSQLQHDVFSAVWDQGVFFAGGYPLEALERR